MGSQKISLRSTNCDDIQVSGNDVQWGNLDREYNIVDKLRKLINTEKNKSF